MISTKKIKSIYLFSALIFLILFQFSCMDPGLTEESSSGPTNQNIMDPTGLDLNLDFEEGLEHWSFNSNKARVTLPEHSIDMELSKEKFSSGNQSLRLKLFNEKLTVSRYFSYSSGDSLKTTIDIFLDVDTSWVFNLSNPYRIAIRFFYYDESGGYITTNGDLISSLPKNQWSEIAHDASLINPQVSYVKYQLEIWGYDTIPFHIDNLKLVHTPNFFNRIDNFSLLAPEDNVHININDSTTLLWDDILEDDIGSYTANLFITLNHGNLSVNNSFETTSQDVCTNDYIYPIQWSAFPYCWDFENWVLDLENGYNPYSMYVSNDISRSGQNSLKLSGLFSDSLQNFNTVWQWASNDQAFLVQPGSELTFEGYIFSPDSNMISGSNTVELGIWAFNERNENYPSISPVFDKTYAPNQWHKFSVSATIPEYLDTERTQCGIYARYNQYNNASGVVYIDDITLTSNLQYKYLVNSVNTNVPELKITPDIFQELFNFWSNWRLSWDNSVSGVQPHADLDTMHFEWEVITTSEHDEVSSSNGPFYFSVSE